VAGWSEVELDELDDIPTFTVSTLDIGELQNKDKTILELK